MNKILVSESFLKNNFSNTLFANAEKLINEKGIDIPREGVVVRCIENGKKILSFKAINPNFLLKYDE
jgi:hypothetical protein